MPKFNERAVLIFSVIGLFASQLSVAGYQVLVCDVEVAGEEYCIKRNEALAKISDSAANVFLALLVPAVYAAAKQSVTRKDEKDH